jgi:hypothetical protein
MSEQFTIQREAEGPGWPFGAGAVAAGSALLGGLVGLATPMAALDWLAYQSYLDQIAGLNPPLGTSAKLAFVALLAVLLGAIGYFVARWAGVRSTGGFADVLARLRGLRDEDEEDAPRLRGSDRHPDAPARRPLSATRDLNVDRASAARGPMAAYALEDLDDDEDELLLISPMAAAVPISAPAPVEPMAPPPLMPVLPLTDHVSESADWPDADWSDTGDDFDIPAPHADDWLVSPAPAPVASATLGEMREADVRLPIAPMVAAPEAIATVAEPVTVAAPPSFTPEFARVTRSATPPPLDLSAARLDELIARVEAGMKRREAVPVVATIAEAAEVEMPAPAAPAASVPSYIPAPVTTDPVAEEADPSFPNDPALAAALATLRRMAAA